MKGFLSYFVIAACVLLAIQFKYHVYTSVIMISACGLAMFINKNNANIVHLCAVLALYELIAQGIFVFIPLTLASDEPAVWLNNTIFLAHLLIDLSLLLVLLYRGALSRALYRHLHKTTAGLHLTYADIAMWLVLVITICTDLYALLENLLRNLEHLGVSEQTAKRYWDVSWMFEHYANIKRWLMGAEFLALWAMSTKMAKREFRSTPP